MINSIGKAMSQQLTVDSIVRLVGDRAVEILQCDAVDIFGYDAANAPDPPGVWL